MRCVSLTLNPPFNGGFGDGVTTDTFSTFDDVVVAASLDLFADDPASSTHQSLYTGSGDILFGASDTHCALNQLFGTAGHYFAPWF